LILNLWHVPTVGGRGVPWDWDGCEA